MSKNEQFFCHAKARFADEGLDRELEELVSSPREKWFFAPHERATTPGSVSMFTIESRQGLDGRMSPHELMALLTVHNETRILAESYRDDPMAAEGIRTLLGLDNEDLIKEVLEGMADFADNLVKVAAVRESLRPEGSVKPHKDLSYWREHFAGPLRDDTYLLGQAVALKLVEVVEGISSRRVVNDEGIARWTSRIKGAGLAKALYLDVLAESWGL